MRLYKQWHPPISKRFIKPPYSISRATSIDSECCRLPTTSVPSNKLDKLRSNQFLSTRSPSFQGHNRVRLSILLVWSAKQGKIFFPCPRSRLRTWSRETCSAVPSCVSLLILDTHAESVLTHGIPPDFPDGVH